MITSFDDILIEPNFLLKKKVLELFYESSPTLSLFKTNSPNYDFYLFIIGDNIDSQNIKYSNDKYCLFDDCGYKDFDIIYSLNVSKYITEDEVESFMYFLINICGDYVNKIYFTGIDGSVISSNVFKNILLSDDIYNGICNHNMFIIPSYNCELKKTIDPTSYVDVWDTPILQTNKDLSYYDVCFEFTKKIQS